MFELLITNLRTHSLIFSIIIIIINTIAFTTLEKKSKFQKISLLSNKRTRLGDYHFACGHLSFFGFMSLVLCTSGLRKHDMPSLPSVIFVFFFDLKQNRTNTRCDCQCLINGLYRSFKWTKSRFIIYLFFQFCSRSSSR